MSRRRISRLGRAASVACIVSFAIVLAACSSSGSKTDSTANAANKKIVIAPVKVSQAAVNAEIARAFLGSVPSSKLDPLTLATLTRAAAFPLTTAQNALLKKCLTQTICHTGHGTLTFAVPASDDTNAANKLNDAETIAQILTYPQVGTIIHTDAQGNLQTFLSNFRSAIAQGANAIVFSAAFFGTESLSVVKEAAAKGIVVVPLNAPVTGAATPADTLLSEVGDDTCTSFSTLAHEMVKTAGKGKTFAQYTGTAGNSFGAIWQPCLDKILKAAGWKLILSGNTNWTPQGEQQAASALIASGKSPDAIVYDYDLSSFARAYLNRGKTPPGLYSAGSSTAGYVGIYRASAKSGRTFPSYIGSALVWAGRIGVTAAMEKLAGESVPTSAVPPKPSFPVSAALKYWSPVFPAETSMGTLLTPSEVQSTLS